ncbi:MAG: DUF4394 domain-containing protein [Verrucomicrobiota bacterium]|nr:DUF4394 domain-containing protein [Verrucomicrobiota bacterium]
MKRNLSLVLAVGLATALAAPGVLRAQTPSPTPSATPPPTVMFGITFFGNELDVVDPATGVARKVGSLQADVSAYGIAARNGRLFTFDPNINKIREISPLSARIIRDIDIGVTGLFGEGDLAFRADGVGFLVSALNGKSPAFTPTNDIYTFNIDTGTSQRIGTTGVAIDGLAFDPTNGTLYGIGQGDCTLYTINQSNGAATAVATISVAFNSPISAIAFSPNGTLFANLDDRLYQVNKTTGAATAVSDTVLDFGVSSVSGLTFGPGAGALGNMSTRVAVGTGDNVGIAGFIIRGNGLKKVLLRGIGPSLTFPGVLPDPVLELFSGQGVSLARNDNWRDSPQAADIAATGLAPSNDKESAILQTLAAGAYTAVLSGVGGSTGIGLVETYDLDLGSGTQLANISTRGFVSTGDKILIGGVIISGSAPQRLAFRAIGPDLSKSNVPNPLPNPMLDIRDANGQSVGSNDDYKAAGQTTELAQNGLTPGDDRDSALITELAPGLYTALVTSANSSSGVALVEIYELSANNP